MEERVQKRTFFRGEEAKIGKGGETETDGRGKKQRSGQDTGTLLSFPPFQESGDRTIRDDYKSAKC